MSVAAIASTNLTDIRELCNDFAEYPLTIQNEMMYDDFVEYFNERIQKTELFEILFKHFLPDEKDLNSSLLFDHLFNLILNELNNDDISDDDTDYENDNRNVEDIYNLFLD